MKRLISRLFVVVACYSSFASAQVADLIITQADIYQHPAADSVAIRDGKIMFVGTESQADSYISDKTEILDLQGAALLPGFIDNHNHIFEAAATIGGDCILSTTAALPQLAKELRRCRREHNRDGWLIGYGFSLDGVLDSGDSAQLSPLDVIDQVFPDQPVIFMEQTSHAMWVNSVALQEAGITQRSDDPQGGKILKDSAGRLNGILLDNAGDQVMELAWNATPDKFEQGYDGLMAGLEEAAAHGITTIGDGRMYWRRGWFDVWQTAEQDGALTARVSIRPWIYPALPMTEQLRYLEQIQSDDPSRLLLVDQVKMYSDGIINNGTAKLLKPYRFTPLPMHPYGLNYIPPKQMKAWISALSQRGYGAHIHAIGDGAVNESLNAIADVRRAGGDNAYTLTHLESVATSDLPRFKSLDVTADFQVGGSFALNHDWAVPYLGKKRASALMNPGAIYRQGANLTISSDWNVNDINPLVGIANSLKMGPRGLPGIDSAVQAYTLNAAKSLGLETITGSIKVGKSADFVVLSRNLTDLTPQQIAATKILMTILQGTIVYERSEQE